MYKISYYFYYKKYNKKIQDAFKQNIIPKEIFTQPIVSYEEYKKVKHEQLKMNIGLIIVYIKQTIKWFLDKITFWLEKDTLVKGVFFTVQK